MLQRSADRLASTRASATTPTSRQPLRASRVTPRRDSAAWLSSRASRCRSDASPNLRSLRPAAGRLECVVLDDHQFAASVPSSTMKPGQRRVEPEHPLPPRHPRRDPRRRTRALDIDHVVQRHYALANEWADPDSAVRICPRLHADGGPVGDGGLERLDPPTRPGDCCDCRRAASRLQHRDQAATATWPSKNSETLSKPAAASPALRG